MVTRDSKIRYGFSQFEREIDIFKKKLSAFILWSFLISKEEECFYWLFTKQPPSTYFLCVCVVYVDMSLCMCICCCLDVVKIFTPMRNTYFLIIITRSCPDVVYVKYVNVQIHAKEFHMFFTPDRMDNISAFTIPKVLKVAYDPWG